MPDEKKMPLSERIAAEMEGQFTSKVDPLEGRGSEIVVESGPTDQVVISSEGTGDNPDGQTFMSPDDSGQSGYHLEDELDMFTEAEEDEPVIANASGFTLEQLENMFTHHPPAPDQIDRYQILRLAAKMFAINIVQYCPQSREATIAVNKVREAVMWANASIACNDGSAESEGQ